MTMAMITSASTHSLRKPDTMLAMIRDDHHEVLELIQDLHEKRHFLLLSQNILAKLDKTVRAASSEESPVCEIHAALCYKSVKSAFVYFLHVDQSAGFLQ